MALEKNGNPVSGILSLDNLNKELSFMHFVGEECVNRGMVSKNHRMMALGVKIIEFEDMIRNKKEYGAAHVKRALEFIGEKEGAIMPHMGDLRKDFEKKWEVRRDLRNEMSFKDISNVFEEVNKIPVEIQYKPEVNVLTRGGRSM